jgi:spore germination protein KA
MVDLPLSPKLEDNLQAFQEIIGQAPDLVVRRLQLKIGSRERAAALVYLDRLADPAMLGDNVVQPLLRRAGQMGAKVTDGDLLEFIERNIVTVPGARRETNLGRAVSIVLRGDSVLFVDGCRGSLILAAREFETRRVEEPTLETVIRGPKEGFTENLNTNVSLLRRRLPDPRLRLQEMKIGRYSQTRVVVAHIAGLATPEMVREVETRLSRIDIDGVLDSGYLEQLIEDAPYSLFPTIGNTEKPDVVAGRLLEGRVAILVDGSPVALTVPRLLYETIQAPEDYYSRPYNSSVIRIIRVLLLLGSIFLPAFYIAIVNFHPEMIPRTLTITLAADREGLPFPLALEVLFFGLIFEGLREAGVRLPRPVGQAVTIVGALILGTAAVDAGLVSAATVIVTAFVGIAGFVTPGLTDVYILSRLFLAILAGVLGLFGLVIGLVVIVTHTCSLRSFGVPYTAPVAPLDFPELKDIFIRAPLWTLTTRPASVTGENRYRMRRVLRPAPPKTAGEGKRRKS